MIKIEYSTGNGYSCSCCRVSDTCEETFQSEDEAMSFCLDAARFSDWDFSILDINITVDENASGENTSNIQGKETDLESRIMNAVRKAEDESNLNKEIKKLQDRIGADKNWLANVQKETARRENSIKENSEKLAELIKKKGD